MNREDIIRMAREAGLYLDGENTQEPLWVLTNEELERFAALVAAAAIKDAPDYKMGYADGVAAEREAILRLEESDGNVPAIAIRARGQA